MAFVRLLQTIGDDYVHTILAYHKTKLVYWAFLQVICNGHFFRPFFLLVIATGQLFYRDSKGWTAPRGRPYVSWLRQVEAYLKG